MELKQKKIMILALPLILALFILLWVNRPVNLGKELIVHVKPGWSFHKLADKLAEENMIHSRSFLVLISKISGGSKRLKTGVYKISDRLSIMDMIQVFTQGQIANRVFTIPEGYNMFQIASLLEEKTIMSSDTFLRLCHDKEILKKYNIKATSAEGFLFPDTYYVPYDIKPAEILSVILSNFFDRVDKRFLFRMKEKGYTLEKAITLASLVEWEAQMDFERPIIASVFINRLKKNLNLASCATVQYALGGHKERLLFRDLKKDSPYNTYIYKGLPPTPIANPGIKSILAVLYPAKVDYLYFVSMKNKRHYFSTTYREHLRAYKQYILDVN
ncbi:MAG: endolytic transglycosylase MltG [Spirochaetes bacterium]|nr:endolytic transglycosylase MltG [Spirochaetota bacterium]